MENANREHGVIAERVLEKKEQKELSKAKDKETASEIRGRLMDITDEMFDAVVEHFTPAYNGEKVDDGEKAKKAEETKGKIRDAVDGAFDSLVDRLTEKWEQKEEAFSKDLGTAKDTITAFMEGEDTGVSEVTHMVEEEIVEDYKKLEEGVVGGYKKVEEGVVGGFNKIADGFVDKFLKKEGESVEEARERLAKEQEKRLEKSRNYGVNAGKSLEKSQSHGYKIPKK